MSIKTLDDLNFDGKRVLVRVDYNTPIDQGEVTDDTRIRASLPTLNRLLDRASCICLMSHLGRPKGAVDPAYSMAPVAKRLSELLDRHVSLISDFRASAPTQGIHLLENLRFHPGETKNDPGFAADLAAFGEIYVDDAFGAAHRAHASIEAITHHFSQKAAGLLLEKEVHYLRDQLRNPEKPFLVILGGAKVSDKIPVIEQLIDKVDQFIIGGAMAYTFLKAKGISVGNSRVEEDFVEVCQNLMAHMADKNVSLLLPVDHVCAETFEEQAQASITLDETIPEGSMGLDIGPESIATFTSAIQQAKTMVWNGPMGKFEWETFETGTMAVGEALLAADAVTIVGGGDSVAAVNILNQRLGEDAPGTMSHLSTGGGASLELLSGKTLPGIAALEE